MISKQIIKTKLHLTKMEFLLQMMAKKKMRLAKKLAELEELLLKMGTTVLHCGEPGAGTRMKLINNLMVLCYCQLNSEALVLAQGLGLVAHNTFDVLTGTLKQFKVYTATMDLCQRSVYRELKKEFKSNKA